jgi:hypothetical protein
LAYRQQGGLRASFDRQQVALGAGDDFFGPEFRQALASGRGAAPS